MLWDGNWSWASDDGAGGLNNLWQLIDSSTRVAVVGSSGNLAYREHGAAINECDVIIRANAAPIIGFEADVGNRTHMRVGWADGFTDAKRLGVITPGEILVRTNPRYQHNEPFWREPMLGKEHMLLALSETWVHQLEDAVLNGMGAPSTGFKALAMAVAIAHERHAPPVRTFGFGACPGCAKYFECMAPAGVGQHRVNQELAWEANGANGHHAFEAERRVRQEWKRAGLIELTEQSCVSFDVNYTEVSARSLKGDGDW